MRFITDDRVVDHGANKRTMAVIAAGLPRCATSSLQKALESDVIGCYPSMHMAHIVPHPERGRVCISIPSGFFLFLFGWPWTRMYGAGHATKCIGQVLVLRGVMDICAAVLRAGDWV